MCVRPVAWPEPDPPIAAKYPGQRPRPLAVQVRDRLGQWLEDEEFAAAFGLRGRPGWSPSRLALVTVLQRVEDLTDRQAAEAVRTRIDWQYLLGLRLDDPGFDQGGAGGVPGQGGGGGAGAGGAGRAAGEAGRRWPDQGGRQAAHRLHARGGGGGGAEPAGAGRGGRAGRGGGAGSGAPGLAGAADLRGRLDPPLRHADDLLAAAAIGGPAAGAGDRLRPGRVRAAGSGL